MSSYSDYANAASDILLKKGEAAARAKEQTGQIWGSTIANLGQTIPKQVQDAMAAGTQRRKDAAIQSVFADQTLDMPTRIQKVMAIDAKKGSDLAKEYGEAQKTAYELQNLQYKYQNEKHAVLMNKLGSAQNQSQWASAIVGLHEAGEDTSSYPWDFTPEVRDQVNLSLVDAKTRLELNKPKPPEDFTLGLNQSRFHPGESTPFATGPTASSASNLDTVQKLRIDAANPNSPTRASSQQILDNLPESDKITGPEQDERYRKIMALPAKSRSAEDSAWAAAYERQKTLGPMAMPVLVQTPTGYNAVDRRSLTSSPITDTSGAPVTPPVTQPQAQDVGYAKRLEDVESTFSTVTPKITKMSLPDYVVQSHMPAALQSKDFQLYDQASRNLINAILRRESGAAISQSEFDNAKRQYLPQPGDTDATLKLKAQNRQRQRESLVQGAGPAYKPDTSSDRVRVKGPNGETGTVPKGTSLPAGWSLR